MGPVADETIIAAEVNAPSQNGDSTPGAPSGIHIGYLVQQFPPELGAGPARVAEMARRWIDAGNRVTVFTGMPNRPQGRIYPGYRRKLWMEEEYEGVRVVRSWLFAHPRHGSLTTLLNNTSFMFTSTVAAVVRGRGLDVLIASEPPFFPHIAGAVAAALRRTPLVLEVRDLWPDYIVEMGFGRRRGIARALFGLERALLRRSDRVVVVTSSFRDRVIEKGVPPERVEVVSNGVDCTLYYRAEEAPPIEVLRHSDGEFVIGYLGNMGAGQALDAVLDAATLLAREDPTVRVVLAGDGPERERVMARAAKLSLHNLRLHPSIPKEQTRAFYNSCDACLVPLAPVRVFQETVPSKLFEVMACERPVILCADGEARAIVEESRCGLVAPPGDARRIADAVLCMRASAGDVRQLMGAKGRAYVERHYSRSSLAQSYLEILGQVAGKNGRRLTT